MIETRTLHYRVDPALRAYCAYIDAEGQGFDLEQYDLFAAGYRARVSEEEAPTPPEPRAAAAEGASHG